MKTSNKLLLGTGICIVFGIFSYAFVMRGAYQKALANSSSNELRIDLEAMKALNIMYDYKVTFKYGKKYEIVMDKTDKDSLRIENKGETLNLSIGNISNVTIYLPQFPLMSFTKKNILNNNGIGNIIVDSSFQSGDFVVASLKNINVEFRNCLFNKVDIQSKEKTEISVNGGLIKLLNLTLPKHSTVNLNYSTVLSKNIVLGDSCNLNIYGNPSTFLK